MNQENISKLEVAIQKMKDKQSRVYLLVQDTKGNATASVAYIYRLAMALHKSGYNTIILHEESEYFGVSTWLGQEYMDELPHQSINGQISIKSLKSECEQNTTSFFSSIDILMQDTENYAEN